MNQVAEMVQFGHGGLDNMFCGETSDSLSSGITKDDINKARTEYPIWLDKVTPAIRAFREQGKYLSAKTITSPSLPRVELHRWDGLSSDNYTV